MPFLRGEQSVQFYPTSFRNFKIRTSFLQLTKNAGAGGPFGAKQIEQAAFRSTLATFAFADASHLEQALAASPDHPDAHYNLGLVRETQGQPEQAAARFAEAIRLRPGFVRAHYSLGSLRQRQGRKAEAISCYERVLELDPAHGAALDALEGLSGE